jgi:hypothetical protein
MGMERLIQALIFSEGSDQVVFQRFENGFDPIILVSIIRNLGVWSTGYTVALLE